MKKIKNLDYERRMKLSTEIKDFFTAKLGKNRKYVVLITYQGNEGDDCHSDTVSNLTPQDSLSIWKLLLASLVNMVQTYLQQYNLYEGLEEEVDGVAPKDENEGDTQ